MNKICTSLEQSKKLLELGIDVKTADMFWDTLFAKKPEAQVNNHHFIGEYDDEHRVPAWSLTALLNIIPKKINFGYENDSTFVLKPLENDKYLADYYEVSFVKDNSIDAVFEMVCWLKENGKL